MVNQRWLSQKLKKSNQKRKWLKDMENKENKENKESVDVTIEVTGVSLTGQASINEHSGIIKSDKEEHKQE